MQTYHGGTGSRRTRRRERGFTIIEVMLFLAISALLILVITSGQNITQRQTQFRDAVDSLEAKLTRLQSERFSSKGREAGGTSANTISFLTMVEFTAGSSSVNIRTCNADRLNGPTFPYNTTGLCTLTETYQLKWGTHAVNSDTIIFYRTHDTGALRTAAGASTGATLLASTYGSAATTTYQVQLKSSNDSFSANLVVNESGRLNQLSRRYL